MAQTPEAKVKTWIRNKINQHYPHAWTYMAPGGRYGRAGVPDILCSINGLFVAIEVKSEIGKCTPKQEYELGKLELSNAITAVIYGKDINRLTKLFDHINKEASKL